MSADGKQPMNYESYILPHQLPDVRPREKHDDPLRDNPDEQLFIRTHQAYEIWFSQILAELEYARLLLSQPPPDHVPESDIPAVEQHVRRATAIFDLIRQHLPLLETLKTTSFYSFRQHLFGASGTQSYRFREVEWLLGLLDNELLDYTKRKLNLEQKFMAEESKPKRGGSSDKHKAAKGNGPTPSEKEYELLARYQEQWQKKRVAGREQAGSRQFEGMQATQDALQRRVLDIDTNGTLREHVMNWLGRATFPAVRGAQPHSRFGEQFANRFQQAYMVAHSKDSRVLHELQELDSSEIKRMNSEAQQRVRFFLDEPHRRAIVFLLQFSNQPLLAWPASLVEALLELDQAFANWRDRHIAMVVKVLGGGRISTLGAAGSGLLYLRETTTKRAFPEILDARAFVLSHEEAKDIYSPQQLSPYGFVHESRPPSDRG